MTKEEVLQLTDTKAIWREMQANIDFKRDNDIWKRMMYLVKEMERKEIEGLGMKYEPNAFYDGDRELDSENWDKNWIKVEQHRCRCVLLATSSRRKTKMATFNIMAPHMCPVCGKTEFPQYYSYDYCDECGWEDDIIKETDITCNDLNLPEFRARYKAGGHPTWLDELDDDEE